MLRTFKSALAPAGRPSSTDPFTVSRFIGPPAISSRNSRRMSPLVVFSLKRPELFDTSTSPFTERSSPAASHAANDHAAVHRSDAAEQDAIRNVNVIFDRNFRAFTFGIAGMHCNLSGSAVVHFNLHLLDVARFTRAGLHCADFHLVAVPTVNMHRAIHVFEHETAAFGQRVDVMEGFVVGKAGAAHAGQCRQQQQSTQRSKQYG